MNSGDWVDGKKKSLIIITTTAIIKEKSLSAIFYIYTFFLKNKELDNTLSQESHAKCPQCWYAGSLPAQWIFITLYDIDFFLRVMRLGFLPPSSLSARLPWSNTKALDLANDLLPLDSTDFLLLFLAATSSRMHNSLLVSGNTSILLFLFSFFVGLC